ncbi:MAG: surface glycan-binding family protein, partial [Candidatus Cryptobacteroides sp.]
MKRKLSDFRTMPAIFAVLACLCLSVTSCTPEGLVDTSEFTLYYPGITDIGPSTNFTVSPTWHGEPPSDFAIYEVTLDGQNYQTDCFTIDGATGEFSISGSDNLPVGKYAISISCMSAGKTFQFANAITVNMLKKVPDGIYLDPSELKVKLDDIISGNSLPTAKICTEGGHISIKGYKIASVRREGALVSGWDKWFKVSTDGVFSFISGDESL